MKVFRDERGRGWTATVRERQGLDYKGRFHLMMVPDGEAGAEGVALSEVRWNSIRTAERTLETMSVVELRRRLRQATGRSAGDRVRAV